MDDWLVHQCDECGKVIEALNYGQLEEQKESHWETTHYLESQTSEFKGKPKEGSKANK